MGLSVALEQVILRSPKRAPYLLGPFRFGGELAAPLSTPYIEQGAVGSLTLVQIDGQFSTSGGKFSFPAQGTFVDGDQGFYSLIGLSRVAGRALLAQVRYSSNGQTTFPVVFARSATANFGGGANGANGTFFGNGGTRIIQAAGVMASTSPVAPTPTTGVDYQHAVVLRITGAFHLVKGGTFTGWTLLWVSDLDSTATIYPAFSNDDAVGTIQGGGPGVGLRVVDLPAPWNSDYGIATQRLAGARTAGDTFIHTADCLIEWTVTTLGATGSDVRFRQQDASNYWKVGIAADGGFSLTEVVAGSPTVRANVAASIASGQRIVIIADGTTIKGYSNNTLRWTYSSATNFQTATAGVLTSFGTSGAYSDLIAWPRTISLPGGY